MNLLLKKFAEGMELARVTNAVSLLLLTDLPIHLNSSTIIYSDKGLTMRQLAELTNSSMVNIWKALREYREILVQRTTKTGRKAYAFPIRLNDQQREKMKQGIGEWSPVAGS